MARNRLILLLISNLFLLQTKGQEITLKDSLWSVITKSVGDTVKVQAFYSYGELFETTSPDTALFYYEKGKSLAKAINSPRGIALSSSYIIAVLNNQGRFSEALELCKEALALYLKYGNSKDQCRGYINIGSEWQYLSDFESAADNYIKGKKLAEELKDLKLQRVVNNNLASVFNSLSQFEKGKSYAEQSLVMARALNDKYSIASSTINLAVSETNLKKNELAIGHFREVSSIGIAIEDTLLQMDGWIGIADNFRDLRKFDSAINYYNQTVRIANQKGYKEYELFGYMGQSDVSLKTGQFKSAESAITKGIILAKSLGLKLELKDLYLRAAELYEATGKLKQSVTYRKEFELLSDSILNEKNNTAINLIEIKFETEKKENKIQSLEKEKEIRDLILRQKNFQNSVLFVSALALVALLFLLYRFNKQKQLLQQNRINELEKEKQLTAASAILQGQEEERSRLARDLHDSLGGLLSGIKHSFSDMKETIIMTPENMLRFEKGLALLDTSINEFRRVAHNMMPESLQKFGLDAAIRDFCAGLNNKSGLQVIYQSYEMDQLTIPNTTSITIYRVIQELLNNILKHAEATEVVVQASKESQKLLITVEDNGKGFDTSILQESEGIGWANIRNRLDFIKGKVDIQSAFQKGTAVNIEINL